MSIIPDPRGPSAPDTRTRPADACPLDPPAPAGSAVVLFLSPQTPTGRPPRLATVRVLPQDATPDASAPAPTPVLWSGRRLAVLSGVVLLVDVPTLGAAGYLFGQTEAGAQLVTLAAAVLLVLIVSGAAVLLLGSGRVHCPGCPK